MYIIARVCRFETIVCTSLRAYAGQGYNQCLKVLVFESSKMARRVTLYWRTHKVMTEEQYFDQVCTRCPATDDIWKLSIEVRRAWDEQYYSEEEFRKHYGSLTFWKEAEHRTIPRVTPKKP